MTTSTDHHPARWSPSILDAVAPVLAHWGLAVHDPFAGEGARLGRLCDDLGLAFTGTEIESEFIVDDRVRPGDSTDSDTYPTGPYVVATSPAYPNGMSDHFRAADGSIRHTYRQALAAILGFDRPLHEHNMGRYGVRSGHRATERHFAIAAACVVWWPSRVVVNVSDFVVAGEDWPVVERWRRILIGAGYDIVEEVEVDTPRQGHGANGSLRVERESVLIARGPFHEH